MAVGQGPQFGSILMRAGGVVKRRWLPLLASMLLLSVAPQLFNTALIRWFGAQGYVDPQTMLLSATIRLGIGVVCTALASGYAAALLLADQRQDARPAAAALADVRAGLPLLLLAAFVLTLPEIVVTLGGVLLTSSITPEMSGVVSLVSILRGLISLALAVVFAPIYALAVDRYAIRRRFFETVRTLTRPHRWMLFGLLVLIILPLMVIGGIITFGMVSDPMTTSPLPVIGVAPVMLALVVGGAMARHYLALANAAFYWERTERARSTAQTADVFD